MTREEKARNLRYKKAALASLEFEQITNEIYNISEMCEEFRWTMEDDDSLIDAMGGDEDEAYEFKMLFIDLAGKCERLQYAITENNYFDTYSQTFNDFTVALLGKTYNTVGYDSEEEDYFNLTRFEGELAQTEAEKRITRMTKSDMLKTWRWILGIIMSYLDIRQQFDYLKASFDILKDINRSILDAVKTVEELYNAAEKESLNPSSEATIRFNTAVTSIPDVDRLWIEC